MSDQPEALRLADALRDGTYLLSVERDATEAELRRLHAENELQKALVAEAQEMAIKLAGANQELLQALEDLLFFDNGKPEFDAARAAIAKHGGHG